MTLRVHCWSVTVSLALAAAAFGDLPAPIQLSEAQPPSDAEWFAYYFHKQARATGRHSCAKPACVGPLELWREVMYFACDEGCPRGPSPPSCGGGYGIVHPMPYYIPNPTLSVEAPRCVRSRYGHESLRDPFNRVDVTLGVWE